MCHVNLISDVNISFEYLGSVHKHLEGGAWAKWKGAKKVLSGRKGGGTKNFSIGAI